MLDIKTTFDKYESEFLKFDRIERKLNSRPDLCAFLLLDTLAPNPGRDIVSSAEHDQIFLDTDCEILAHVATEQDILTLARCGVMYDSETDSLSMFA